MKASGGQEWFWVSMADGPNDFELAVGRMVERFYSDSDLIRLKIFSISYLPFLAFDFDLEYFFMDIFGSFICVERFLTPSKIVYMNPVLKARSRSAAASVHYERKEISIDGELIAIFIAPAAENGASSVDIAIGQFATLCGSQMINAPLFDGFVNLKRGKLITRKIALSRPSRGHDTFMFMKDFHSLAMQWNELPSGEDRALDLIGRAFSQTSPAIKIVYLRSALEVIFGRSDENKIRQLYSEEKLRSAAIGAFKRVREDRRLHIHKGYDISADYYDIRVLEAVIYDRLRAERHAVGSFTLLGEVLRHSSDAKG